MGRASLRSDPWPAVVLACGLGFVLLAALVARRGGVALDEPLAAAIRALPFPLAFWEALTFLGGDVLILVGGALVLAALASGRVRLALILGVALLIAALLTDAVKGLVARPRPPDPLVLETGFSFPSGHTLNSTTTYGLVALVTWRARALLATDPSVARRIGMIAVVAGVAIPCLVGLSRIALGVHWPSDVLAGWLAGAALVGAAATLIDRTSAMHRDLPGARAGPGDRRAASTGHPPALPRVPPPPGPAPTTRPPAMAPRRRRGRAPRG